MGKPRETKLISVLVTSALQLGRTSFRFGPVSDVSRPLAFPLADLQNKIFTRTCFVDWASWEPPGYLLGAS